MHFIVAQHLVFERKRIVRVARSYESFVNIRQRYITRADVKSG